MTRVRQIRLWLATARVMKKLTFAQQELIAPTAVTVRHRRLHHLIAELSFQASANFAQAARLVRLIVLAYRSAAGGATRPGLRVLRALLASIAAKHSRLMCVLTVLLVCLLARDIRNVKHAVQVE